MNNYKFEARGSLVADSREEAIAVIEAALEQYSERKHRIIAGNVIAFDPKTCVHRGLGIGNCTPIITTVQFLLNDQHDKPVCAYHFDRAVRQITGVF